MRLKPEPPPLIDTSLKNVLSKSSAAANVIRASPRPRSRNDSRARTTATTAANAAPTNPPTNMFNPRWCASCAAVNAPTPAKVPWQSDSCPAIPVISVMDNRTVERAIPELNTPSHTLGIHVNIETMNTARTTHHSRRMMRSMLGARDEAAIGGGGGSIVARGSRFRSRERMPGRMRSAATRTKNGSDGRTAE